MIWYLLIYLTFSSKVHELYSSLVGGGNATIIGCQPLLKLIEEEKEEEEVVNSISFWSEESLHCVGYTLFNYTSSL